MNIPPNKNCKFMINQALQNNLMLRLNVLKIANSYPAFDNRVNKTDAMHFMQQTWFFSPLVTVSIKTAATAIIYVLLITAISSWPQVRVKIDRLVTNTVVVYWISSKQYYKDFRKGTYYIIYFYNNNNSNDILLRMKQMVFDVLYYTLSHL